MEISEIVEKINNGQKVGDVAKLLGISQSTLSRNLKLGGYFYNNKMKVYELVGNIPNGDVSDLVKSSEKFPKNDEVKVEQNEELALNKEEIKFIKDSYKRQNLFDKKFELIREKSELPSKKPEKKVPYIISDKTFKEFKDFAQELENEYRITQNELVEIALQKFMRDFR